MIKGLILVLSGAWSESGDCEVRFRNLEFTSIEEAIQKAKIIECCPSPDLWNGDRWIEDEDVQLIAGDASNWEIVHLPDRLKT